MIKILLWDVDGTLLNFEAAEEVAVRNLFREYGFGECTDEMLKRYQDINRYYWEKLERKEITRAEVLINRFLDFFKEYDLDQTKAEAFNASYQSALGETIVFNDNSKDLIISLKDKVKQYVVTNGSKVAQDKKLSLSGLGNLMDGIFISEIIGIEKPDAGFFKAAFDDIDLNGITNDEIMIIGDSLTSDIKGGNNAGIKTCWYNPAGKDVTGDAAPDYIIRSLSNVADLI